MTGDEEADKRFMVREEKVWKAKVRSLKSSAFCLKKPQAESTESTIRVSRVQTKHLASRIGTCPGFHQPTKGSENDYPVFHPVCTFKWHFFLTRLLTKQ